MIHFFGNQSNTVFAVQTSNPETSGEISAQDISKLNWLFGNAHKIEKSVLADFFCWTPCKYGNTMEYQCG